MSEPVEAVIFDLGNVLITVREDIALERVCAATGRTAREMSDFVMTTPFVTQLATGKLAPRRFFEIVAQEMGFGGSYEEFAQIWGEIFEPIPEMIEVVERLRGRLPRYLLSNTNAIHMDYVFAHFPFIHTLDGLVLSHEAGWLKPDARIYAHALAKFGLVAGRAVFIDDLQVNVEGARAVGLQAIHHRTPAATRAELTKLGVVGI